MVAIIGLNNCLQIIRKLFCIKLKVSLDTKLVQNLIQARKFGQVSDGWGIYVIDFLCLPSQGCDKLKRVFLYRLVLPIL